MKLMLVDDHPLFLEGLRTFWRPMESVWQVWRTTAEALLKARIIRPDIILMDINMPVCGGLDALQLIKAEMPEIKIIMLTIADDAEDLLQAVKYGASGYLLKSINANELIDALNDIEKGYTNLSPDFAARLFNEYEREDTAFSPVQADALTERQLEVLKMAARGIPYKEIGKALGLSERTIKYRMGRLLELLHLENRAQVIAYAAKMGLVEDKEKQ